MLFHWAFLLLRKIHRGLTAQIMADRDAARYRFFGIGSTFLVNAVHNEMDERGPEADGFAFLPSVLARLLRAIVA